MNEHSEKENISNTPISDLAKRVNLDYQHSRMIEYFVRNGIYSYNIVEAKSNYYKLSLKERREVLGASCEDVLCKTIVLENTAFVKEYESKYYKQYYLAVVQYTNEFHADKIARSLKTLQNANAGNAEKLSNKFFHMRVAKEEIAYDMSGYKFNCITPYLMKDER